MTIESVQIIVDKIGRNPLQCGNIATTLGIEGPGPQRTSGRQRVNCGILGVG